MVILLILKEIKLLRYLFRRRERIVWDQVESLEDLGESERGDGGFGSTGK